MATSGLLLCQLFERLFQTQLRVGVALFCGLAQPRQSCFTILLHANTAPQVLAGHQFAPGIAKLGGGEVVLKREFLIIFLLI